LLPKLGVDINNLNLTDLQSLLPKLGISDETDLEDNSDLLIIAILLGLGYSIEQIRRLFPNIQLGPRPDLDPNAPNAANPGLDEAIDQLLRDNRIPGLEAIPNPDFDPNNVNQPGNTPVIPAQPPLETGEEPPAEDYIQETGDNDSEFLSTLRAPSRRHYLNNIDQRTVAKDLNTVIEPNIDIAADMVGIRSGLAERNGETFQINGRIYGQHNGILYPISGTGFHQLDRPAFKALGVYNKFGDTSRSEEILSNMGIPSEARETALSVWRLSQ
jgi:hypothetical protein